MTNPNITVTIDAIRNGVIVPEIDVFNDVKEAITDVSEAGWEIDTPDLLQTSYIVRDGRRVLAVGYYALPSEALVEVATVKPMLVWQLVETGETMIRNYEAEYRRIIEANEGIRESEAA